MCNRLATFKHKGRYWDMFAFRMAIIQIQAINERHQLPKRGCINVAGNIKG